jgi:MYXO-CTERM domain-containing protein
LEPRAPAINSAGDLFAGDYSGRIHEDTPGGAQSTLASGLNEPVGPAFQTVPELPALGLLGLGATALLARRRRTGV